MQIRFTLPVRPTTKKTSSEIVGFGKPCFACRRPPYNKLVPSAHFEKFEEAALAYGAQLRRAIEASGRVKLPITEQVSIKALFYREALRGDFAGFIQALGDVLQEGRYKGSCRDIDCSASIILTASQINNSSEIECSKCGRIAPAPILAFKAKQSRKGLGIICDDVQIADWDGTRLLKDAKNPRIEITITVIQEDMEKSLFDGLQDETISR